MKRIGFLIIVFLVFSVQVFAHKSGKSYYDTLIQKSTSDSTVNNLNSSTSTYNRMTNKARNSIAEEYEEYEEIKPTQIYYKSIIDDAKESRWLFPMILSFVLENNAFNKDGCKISLSDSLFGEATTIKDIFLLSRLSYDDKLRIHPTGYAGVPQFGHVKSEQYLALLAPVEIALSTGQNVTDFSFSGMYRYRPFLEYNLFAIFGFDVPVSIQSRSIDLMFQDGSLYHTGYVGNVTVRETTITQFFKDFTSVEDFFLRAVLEPKGIVFSSNQQKIGIGDISLFSIIEFGDFFTEFGSLCIGIDSAQLGINISFPTGTKSTGEKLWEVEFGNGGGCQFSPFASVNIRTNSSYINPIFNFGFEFNTSFSSGKSGGIRIPRLVIQDTEIKVGTNPDIISPVFKEYYAVPFEEIDTTVPIFADILTDDAIIKLGRRLFFGFGNYIYNIFKRNFRLGIFYTYSNKSADEVIASSDFDVSSLSCLSDSISHRISWNLTYKFESDIDLGFGSQHIVSGINVPQQNEVFLSLAIYF